jgi:hypothetical protein
MAIDRTRATEAPLELRYTFNPEQWTARRAGDDLSASLDPTRANFMLSILEGLKVTRWLSPTDEAADTALATPSLRFKIVEKATNDLGDFTGLITREVHFAPGSSGPNPGFYYGRASSDSHPFLLDRDTYTKLALEILEGP